MADGSRPGNSQPRHRPRRHPRQPSGHRLPGPRL